MDYRTAKWADTLYDNRIETANIPKETVGPFGSQVVSQEVTKAESALLRSCMRISISATAETREIFKGDSGALYEGWAKEYGPVYQIPAPFGGRRVILTDPKAISHFYSKESSTYVQNKFMRRSIESLVR